MTTYTSPSIEATVAQMKREILLDIQNGDVPTTVQTFGDLHDFIDANCYGGFCDDSYADFLIAYFGGRDEFDGMPQAMLDFMNVCQDQINEWLGGDEFTTQIQGESE